MATEFYSYYNIPTTLPEFDWKKTTSQTTNWDTEYGSYDRGTVLQKKAYSAIRQSSLKKFNAAIPPNVFNDKDALKEYVLKTGAITEASAKEANIDLDDLESLQGIIGVILSGNTDKKYSMASEKIVYPNLRKLQQIQKYTDQLDEVVTALQGKGASDANIIDILSNKTFKDADDLTVFAKGIESLPDNIGDALKNTEGKKALEELDIWGEISSALGKTGSQSGNTWGGTASEEGGEGGTTGGTPLNTKPTKSTTQVVQGAVNEIIEGTPRTDVTKTLKDEVTLNNVQGAGYAGQNLTIKRDPNNPENYSIVDADNPRIVYMGDIGQVSLDAWLGRLTSDTPEEEWYDYTDPEGNPLDYKNGQYQYPDGTTYTEGGAVNDLETYTNKEKEAISNLEGMADEFSGLRGEYDSFVTSVTGGDVNAGVAKELGWTDNGDGTWTDYSDPENPVTYEVNEETGLLEKDGVTATTKGTFEENDFAGQINAQLDRFLTGKDADGNDILDDEGNPIKGFLDYQSDLEDAAETYKTDMQDLAGYRDPETGEWVDGLYDSTYKNYEGELRPLRDEMGGVRGKLGGVADAQLAVAKDAGNTDYYTRLSDLLYEQSRDEVNRDARGAQETLNTMYANAGLDPSSPAFTAAMKDLAQSRSDALVSSRRQAILDSYGLGSNMLANRSNALSGAGSALNSQMSAIGTEMGALDSLYGVKLEGLNTRRDMIGQIYGADKDIAATGISGLNTVLKTNLQGIDADKEQYFKGLDLSQGAFNTKFDIFGKGFDVTSGLIDLYNKEGQDALNLILDKYSGDTSNQLTLETLRQYAKENPNYTIDPDLEKFLSGGR